jgi:hypothetical protein
MFISDIAKKKAELQDLELKQDTCDKLSSSRVIECRGTFYQKGCGEKLPIKDLTYIQTHWYESPWGCTGGDSWHEGEANFVCPKCGARNRPCMYKEWDLIKDNKFSLIKSKFKEHVNEYDRR